MFVAIISVAALFVGAVTLWFVYQGDRSRREKSKPQIGFNLESWNRQGQVSLVFRNRGDCLITNLRMGVESGNTLVWSKSMTLERGAVASDGVTVPPADLHRFLGAVDLKCGLIAEFEANGKAWRAYQDASGEDKPARVARIARGIAPR